MPYRIGQIHRYFPYKKQNFWGCRGRNYRPEIKWATKAHLIGFKINHAFFLIFAFAQHCDCDLKLDRTLILMILMINTD